MNNFWVAFRTEDFLANKFIGDNTDFIITLSHNNFLHISDSFDDLQKHTADNTNRIVYAKAHLQEGQLANILRFMLYGDTMTVNIIIEEYFVKGGEW